MLVRGPVFADGLVRFDDVLVAPEDADGARLSLEVKWPGGGSVLWRQASMLQALAPEPRKVKVGTVYLRPRNSTLEKNLQLWCDQIDAAGKLGLDIVCLGETILAVGTSATIQDCAQPIPGPLSEKIAPALQDNRCVVLDRWLSSMCAYQGYAGGFGTDKVVAIATDVSNESGPI